ncbi:hypothetical protein TrRE_jg9529 [Triparma retinervis]|uniref:Uncharacterized protein n=1 Tax=Triparma retinervis TaxID=2557542 RepID=A0A9W6Z9E5_9STRA|nr:hypothetical protein TrRE_jg9529 [Triparma retinervis]
MDDWRRRGLPERLLDLELRKNPAAEDRQREDLRTLVDKNKNPRLHELTSGDLRRSAKFTYDEHQDPIDNQIFKMKAGSISRFTGESLESVTDRMSMAQISFSPKHKRGGGGHNGSQMMASATAGSMAKSPTREMSEVEIEDAPVMKKYEGTVTQIAPPTFGHRPGSGQRTFNPVAMGIRKDKNLKLKSSKTTMRKKGGKFVSGIMSTSMLKHLLTAGEAGDGMGRTAAREHAREQNNEGGFGGGGGGDTSGFDRGGFDDLSIETAEFGAGGGALDTTLDTYDSNLQHSFTTLSPKHAIEPTNHQSYFDEVYKVPEKKERPDWNESFAALKYDVRETRPLLVLNREDREAKTLDRINKFRLLAAGKTKSVTTDPGRDESMVSKSLWKEELDRKFNKLDRTGTKISPRSASINRDIRGMIKEEKVRKMRQEQKIREWERIVEEERTEKLIARRKGRGKLIA